MPYRKAMPSYLRAAIVDGAGQHHAASLLTLPSTATLKYFDLSLCKQWLSVPPGCTVFVLARILSNAAKQGKQPDISLHLQSDFEMQPVRLHLQ
jgi:hypothetical protein